MIKITDIYVGTTLFLLQQINFCWCRHNIQHSMLADREFNNIAIEHYRQERFLTLFYNYVYLSQVNWL